MSINTHKPNEQITDWRAALRYLQEGNLRYRTGKAAVVQGTTAADREILQGGQMPFATIYTCADSRVAPEICFDQKLGDLFVIRVAANTIDDLAMGTIEFAAEVVKTPLIVVVSHSDCRAVMAAYGGAKFTGHLEKVMERVRPAVAKCRSVSDAIQANMDYVVGLIRDNDAVCRNGVMVMGAYHEIETGQISFDDLPENILPQNPKSTLA